MNEELKQKLEQAMDKLDFDFVEIKKLVLRDDATFDSIDYKKILYVYQQARYFCGYLEDNYFRYHRRITAEIMIKNVGIYIHNVIKFMVQNNIKDRTINVKELEKCNRTLCLLRTYLCTGDKDIKISEGILS